MDATIDGKTGIYYTKKDGHAIQVRYIAPDRVCMADEVEILEARDLNGLPVELKMEEQIDVQISITRMQYIKHMNHELKKVNQF